VPAAEPYLACSGRHCGNGRHLLGFGILPAWRGRRGNGLHIAARMPSSPGNLRLTDDTGAGAWQKQTDTLDKTDLVAGGVPRKVPAVGAVPDVSAERDDAFPQCAAGR
jgi:hypothetical protein